MTEPLFIAEGADAPRPELPFVERDSITAIVRDPVTDMYLCLRWKQVDWETFVTGGIEPGQTAEEAARAEVREETGYTRLRLVKELPRMHEKFFHKPKGVNRFAHFTSFLFELESDDREEISEAEKANHKIVWLTEAELKKFRLPACHRFLLQHI